MSHAVTPEQDQRARRKRLVIIIGLGALVVLCVGALSVVGSRRVDDGVDDGVDDLRRAASAANVDPSVIAISAYGTGSDPVSEALGSDRVVSLQEQTNNRWCVETHVSALLSSQTVYFVIDEAGRFVETAGCGE
jgi:hypothetical protein